MRAALDRATGMDDVVRRAGELSAQTMIFDVEPLVAYWDGGQEAGGSSCRAAAGGYPRRLARPPSYTAAPAPQRSGMIFQALDIPGGMPVPGVGLSCRQPVCGSKCGCLPRTRRRRIRGFSEPVKPVCGAGQLLRYGAVTRSGSSRIRGSGSRQGRARSPRRSLTVSISQAASGQPPDPLRRYQILEITISAGSSAVGQALGDATWPPGWIPVTILDNHTLRDPDPGITLAPGDRVNLLAREPHTPVPPLGPAARPIGPERQDL